VYPLSTSTDVPVTKDASSLARKATTLATFSGSPQACAGRLDTVPHLAASEVALGRGTIAVEFVSVVLDRHVVLIVHLVNQDTDARCTRMLLPFERASPAIRKSWYPAVGPVAHLSARSSSSPWLLEVADKTCINRRPEPMRSTSNSTQIVPGYILIVGCPTIIGERYRARGA